MVGKKIFGLEGEDMSRQFTIRLLVGMCCLAGLAGVYLFQRYDFSALFGTSFNPLHRFLINRTVRFLLNDILAIALIYALFEERKYVIFSVWVQIAGMILFLLPYFLLKIYFPSYNGPLISFIHRLILNPVLLLLLIPAFYYQRHQAARRGN